MRAINRIEPLLPAAAMQTYSIAAPLATHTRPATCAEVECLPYRNGWNTDVDEATVLGQQQAGYIRSQAGRAYTESRIGNLTRFVFLAGQQCFAAHRVSLERPEIYLVKGGDWRGNPIGLTRRHTKPAHWVEDFAEHLDVIKKERD